MCPERWLPRTGTLLSAQARAPIVGPRNAHPPAPPGFEGALSAQIFRASSLLIVVSSCFLVLSLSCALV